MKKLIIIGAGVSGLSTGIFALKKGYDVTIYEKNNKAGGCLTGWNRSGMYIDNCMHWLTGTNQHTSLFKLWKQVGGLDETSNLYQMPYFYKSIFDDYEMALYTDVEKTREKLLAISKEDAKEINRFINCVKVLINYNRKSNIFSHNFYKIIGFSKAFIYYKRISLYEFANKFRNKNIKKFFTDYLPENYSALSLCLSYATFASGDGKVYMDGSKALADKIVNRFISLGGKIYFNSNVSKLNIENGLIKSAIINNDEITGDVFVSTIDAQYTFKTLLSEEYMPHDILEKMNDKYNYPLLSNFGSAYTLAKKETPFKDTIVIPIDKIKVGVNYIDRLVLKEYSYLYKYDKNVFQCFIVQDEKDYLYWQRLNDEDIDKYNSEKKQLAEELLLLVIKHFPKIEGSVKLIDSWTPVTYNTYFNTKLGAYMGFTFTKNSSIKSIPFSIKGLSNLFYVSVWCNPCGGLPVALSNGFRFVKKHL